MPKTLQLTDEAADLLLGCFMDFLENEAPEPTKRRPENTGGPTQEMAPEVVTEGAGKC